MESEIGEKVRIQRKYEDAISSGKTAVIGDFSSSSSNCMRINIGNFPPKSSALLKIFYYQHLLVEDASYCLRIPMSYIPKYLGDIRRYVETGLSYKGQNAEEEKVVDEESKQQRLNEMSDHFNIQTLKFSPYLWNISLTLQMNGQIRRLVSLNHKIETTIHNDDTRAEITLS